VPHSAWPWASVRHSANTAAADLLLPDLPQPMPPLLKLVSDMGLRSAAEPRPPSGGNAKTGRAPGPSELNVWGPYTDGQAGTSFSKNRGRPFRHSPRRTTPRAHGQLSGRRSPQRLRGGRRTWAPAARLKEWPALRRPRIPAWLSAQGYTCRRGYISTTTSGELRGNALVGGSGHPQGVGRACCGPWCPALPGITVTHGKVDGQPTPSPSPLARAEWGTP